MFRRQRTWLPGEGGRVYHDTGRWVLAVAPLLGWLVGSPVELPPIVTSALFAFLAGGVLLNVLKEELQEDRENRFWAFAAGSAGYALRLLVTQ